MLPIAILAAGFLAAPAAPVVVRLMRPAAGWFLAGVPAAVAVALAFHAAGAWGGHDLAVTIDWLPALGMNLSLRIDGLATLFGLLISGVGTLIFIYAGSYLRTHAQLGRFFSFLMLFFAAMLGIAFADNLLLLYIFWELTTVSSWLLIGFEHQRAEAREAAWQALMVTTAGGLALLTGFVLLGATAGSYEISALGTADADVRQNGVYVAILLLVLFGVAAKSALLPLHFWLPNAMVAPTPVSAYLHSAAMVKAGVFLLARLSPAMADTFSWSLLVTSIGGATAVVAAWLALLQADLKRLLAYTTISALGMMTLALGIGGAAAAQAAIVLLFAHGLYKAGLFMVAGAIDHGAGTRDLRHVGGLWRAMPLTALGALMTTASMVGLPPSLGYVAEERLVDVAHAQAGWCGWLILAVVLVSGTLYTAAGFVVGVRPFVGRKRAPRPPHETSPGVWLGPVLLGAAGLVAALTIRALSQRLFAPAVADVAGVAPAQALSLWHGVTVPFVFGVGLLAGGAVVAVFWERVRAAAKRFTALGRVGPDHGYALLVRGLNAAATHLDRHLQHGYLPAYLSVILLTALALVAPPAWRTGIHIPAGGEPIRIQDLLLVGLLLVAALGAILMRTRLGVVACTTVVGFSVALFFASHSGPDLAMTQVLAETILTLLIISLLPLLPPVRIIGSRAARLGKAAVCLGAGALVTILLFAAKSGATPTALAAYYRAQSEQSAHGLNIVNTILVNFRAIDTLGEVSVLAAAAIGVLTLLRGQRRDRSSRRDKAGSSVLAVGALTLLPLMLVFSAFLLLTGHNVPGGGFAAGLVIAVALALYVLGRPSSGERELVRLHPRALLATGLIVMAGSGLLALAGGRPFLEALWLTPAVPLLGGLHLGTPLLFDVGIYIASAGAVFLLLRSLEEYSPWKS